MGDVHPLRPHALEFFAGAGLARRGLEQAGIAVSWANDIERIKQAMYSASFGDDHFVLGDIADVTVDDLPSGASIAWASSPCTDLSLAGDRAGLAGRQSGTLWHYLRLLAELGDDRPAVAVIENVTGLASSHGGDDIIAAILALNEVGYSVDVLAIDARRWLPQSRPRLFVVGALTPPDDDPTPHPLRPAWLSWLWSDPRLRLHRAALPEPPEHLESGLGSMVEEMSHRDERWWDDQRTAEFVSSLSPLQWERMVALRRRKMLSYRTAYRRTRNGVAVWEMRADDISGCLRTARGGSSKQAVVKLGYGRLQVRWMTPLEYARLMGAEDIDTACVTPTQALYCLGDAVAVPAVAWLAEHYLMPLVRGALHSRAASVATATVDHR